MRFAYFSRLSAADQKIYIASDAIVAIPLVDAPSLQVHVRAIAAALGVGDRDALEGAANDLVLGLCATLDVPPVTVSILAVRPRSATSELHGLYTRPLASDDSDDSDDSDEPTSDDSVPQIEVWMRTAHHQRVVAFRTFLRTLLHEVCHHLDYELHRLADSFHTEGFYQRESSLLQQLAPRP